MLEVGSVSEQSEESVTIFSLIKFSVHEIKKTNQLLVSSKSIFGTKTRQDFLLKGS